jgi:hypothetical protein
MRWQWRTKDRCQVQQMRWLVELDICLLSFIVISFVELGICLFSFVVISFVELGICLLSFVVISLWDDNKGQRWMPSSTNKMTTKDKRRMQSSTNEWRTKDKRRMQRYTKSSFDQWSDEIWLTASYDF